MQHPQEQNNLRRVRERLGLSQEDIADKIGCNPKTVGRWERGLSTPNPYYRRRLAKHLGTSVQGLGLFPELEPLGENGLQHDKLSQAGEKETLPGERFYGRERELELLEQWIIKERAGVVLVSGVGGIGKTSLVRALEKKIGSSFSTIIWYPLQTAPSFREFVTEYIRAISPQQRLALPEGQNDQVTYFLTRLEGQRSLLILDNFESILQSGNYTGKYLDGYEAYGLLLERMTTGVSQSCLLLTSREKPREFLRLQGKSVLVRSLQLPGIPTREGLKLLANQGLTESEVTLAKLVQLYSGNPLALKLIAGYVRALFGGDTTAFLQAEKTAFGDIYDLLEQQF